MISVGDIIEVVSVSICYSAYVRGLNSYIGRVGIVLEIDHPNLGVGIKFPDGRIYYYPMVCIRLHGDTTKHLSKEQIENCTYVKIFDDLTQLTLSNINNDISKKLHDRQLSSIFNYSLLQGKRLILSRKNMFVNIVDISYGLPEDYVGVVHEGVTHYLPLCVLFNVIPTYEPRKINIK